MNHLEEGTVHAWLDGALDATESAEIDAHLKSCAECAAKVAEARGLIAASSRILTALDDVPANVVPKAAPVAPARRRRSITPWLSGLAAAVVLVMLWRTGGVEQKAVTQVRIPDVQVTPAVSEPSLERLKEPAPPVATAPAVTSASRVAGVAAGAGAAALDTMVARAEGRRATLARERSVASESRIEILENPRKDNTSPVIGCYQIADAARQEAVVTALSDQQPKAAATGAAVRRAAAPSAQAPAMQKAADMSMTVTTVRLDSGNVVRFAGTDSTIGRWIAVSGDSVRIVMKGQTTVVSSLTRVRCP